MRWHKFTGQIMSIVFAALPIIGNKLETTSVTSLRADESFYT
jgi:hypothetical protein